MSLKSNRKFWDSCFSALSLYSFISSPTVGKGGRRKGASFLEAAISQVNTEKHKHTEKGYRNYDQLLLQQSNSAAERHECLKIHKRATCEALLVIITCQG